ncbi:MAG: hypothetical protein IJT94_09770 [Oscillibacter sp.]|nr:hypothetical protein [Oscillibacter sp.]
MTVTKAYLQSMGIPEAVATQILADVARDTAEMQKAAQTAGAPAAPSAAPKTDQTAARSASPLAPLTPFPGQASAPSATVPNLAPPPAQPQTAAAPKVKEKPADGDTPAPAEKTSEFQNEPVTCKGHPGAR